MVSRRLRSGRYKITQYKEQLISKGRSKHPRVISIATAQDRIVMYVLAQVVGRSFGLSRPELAQAKVKKLSQALDSNQYTHYLRIDLIDFFGSIDHAALEKSLRKRIRKTEILDLIMAIVATSTVAAGSPRHCGREYRGVPQGLPIANILAELVLQPVDDEFIKRKDIAYHRFVDDVLVLGAEDLVEDILTRYIGSIAPLGLRAHALGQDSKTAIGSLSDKFDFLGYEFHGKKRGVRASSVRKIENTLAKNFSSFRHAQMRLVADASEEARRRQRAKLEWRVNLVISGCIIHGTRRGWLAYFVQLNDLTLLKRLDGLLAHLRERHAVPESVRLKSFMRAYWALTRPNARRRDYIPNFDKASDEEQSAILTEQFDISKERVLAMAVEDRRSLFEAKILRLVTELEKDVGVVS